MLDEEENVDGANLNLQVHADKTIGTSQHIFNTIG
jgi:hypothetical protein